MASPNIHHHFHSHTTPQPSLPDLTTAGSASTTSNPSIRTPHPAPSAPPFAPHFPALEDNNGVLEQRPSVPVYQCTFWFLSCGYASTDRREWETHCKSHWRGVEPPRWGECLICMDWKIDYRSRSASHDAGYRYEYENSWNGWRVWDMRLAHMASHFEDGSRLELGGSRRPRKEPELYRYLWQKKLIDRQGLKDLLHGERVDEVFVVTGAGHGDMARRERDRDRRRGGGRREDRGRDRERDRGALGRQSVGVAVALGVGFQ